VITVPGAEKLDFRDVEAFDANTAYILSIGDGDASRIYKTTDGGKTWKLQFKNDDPKKFFDAIACRNRSECYAVSDPVGGVFPIIVTPDGGRYWELESSEFLYAAQGEAAFAASGTCLISSHGKLFLVSGGSAAKVYKFYVAMGDYGLSPGNHGTVTPILSGTTGSGIFSIAMFDKSHGVIVGGNYEKPDEHEKNLAFTTDGGATWTLKKGLTGYRSGVTYVDRRTIIAVGANGSDITRDGGETWTVLGKEDLNAVASKGPRATWAVGPKGMVVKLK
ncbi:MAG: glycosyl hydrolase, partial [Acidobacteria bacterium]|nr:glycosyl hydrolase [Acidobacteriota bacterium]